MTILNTKDAFRLYNLLGQFLPDDLGDTLLDFIGKIVDNIIDAGVQEVYIKAVMLMSGMTFDEIIEKGPEDTLLLFAEGLANNDILSLKEFTEKI